MFPPFLQSAEPDAPPACGATKVTVSGSFSFQAGGFQLSGQGMITFETVPTPTPTPPALP